MSIRISSMTTDASEGRLLPLVRADGHRQMALDLHLLQQTSTAPVLRFYHWSGPWLSLGRNQRHWPDHWNDLASAGALSLVRRPSGGQAVLHQGGLTYALIWPNAPRQRHQAYREACQWLIDGFRTLQLELQFGDEACRTESANCFARSTAADLVDPNGVKRIGSAQRWQQGRLLQHGEIVLDPPAELWRSVFGQEAPDAASPLIPRQGLDRHLQTALRRQWSGMNWVEQPFSEQEAQALGLASSASDDCIVSTT